ncbi:heavy metal translocating P-type ATPase [Devosia psychrophila]|uniref:Cu2+-exporting ATPase n=2 Tax=Devosia psychrophila TaxID=728005 RepID=A0A1I1MX39_9HYPH|nr:heavy metal translocating P-type ATPase [Devosia psychrophila]SFC89957.1 Cu2+-exporting ATPase [Devosia psychrophila]
MSCCLPPPEFIEAIGGPIRRGPSDDELRLASRDVGGGMRQTDLSVPDIHCGGCVQTIEKALGALRNVDSARVNLSTKRVAIRWLGDGAPPAMVETLLDLGYEPGLYETHDDGKDNALPALIRALAVAAFASMNIMMLSGSVWSGANGPTRDILHWICAGLALPAMLYSGRVFYLSAWNAIWHRRTNMDVPITIGIALAFALSLYDTIHSGEQVYFDATVSLIFFLLIGRTLDHVMRERARTAVKSLARLAPRGALVVQNDSHPEYLPLSEITPGMTILLAAGERVPVDAVVLSGASDLDRSLISGESVPIIAEPGTLLEAGILNLTGPLTIRAAAAEQDSTLANIIRLMEVAESGRGRYRRIADRAAELYSPVVHLAALTAFVGWMLLNGDLHTAVTVAIAVLIITCPCALGLAVPMVQVVAAQRLFVAGIMVKDGSALERLAEIDMVVFDKTGTLTSGSPQLLDPQDIDPGILGLAASLAVYSRHPYSLAIARANSSRAAAATLTAISEHPGLGIEATKDGDRYRLGRADWAVSPGAVETGTVLSCNGTELARFRFRDALRPGAGDAVKALRNAGVTVEIVSGDTMEAVAIVAGQLHIATHFSGVLPGGKAERIATLRREGHKVLMVGDGLNDAPALMAAHASMAPSSAADVGRSAADFVFLHDNLAAVPMALTIASDAGRLVQQNFALSVLYNAIALPVAIAGLVNPFIAAVAMSLSSIIVVLNALRLGWGGHRTRPVSANSVPYAAASRS